VSLLERLFTRRRLHRYLLAMLAGAVLGFIILVATSKGLNTIRGGRMGGDLPEFYGAGRMVRSGHASDLYDWRAQQAGQRDLWPETERGWMPFVYPPFVALAYVPLTWLPFKAAYVVHVLAMGLCVVAAIALLRQSLPPLRMEWLPAVAATVTFYPIFRAVLGGQNTPLSLLCAAGAAAALARERDAVAGLWVGAWLFKPQLALPVAAVLVFRSARRLRFLLGIAVVAGVYYAAGVLVGGWTWPIWWLREGVAPYAPASLAVDRGNGISFAELASELGVVPLNWIAAAVTGAFAVWTAWRGCRHPAAVVAIAAGTAVLVGPHAIYYDGGVAALGLIAAAALRPTTAPAVAGLWALALAQPFRASLPLPPMTVVVVLSMWLAVRTPTDGRI
jgi:hypothetical protein